MYLYIMLTINTKNYKAILSKKCRKVGWSGMGMYWGAREWWWWRCQGKKGEEHSSGGGWITSGTTCRREDCQKRKRKTRINMKHRQLERMQKKKKTHLWKHHSQLVSCGSRRRPENTDLSSIIASRGSWLTVVITYSLPSLLFFPLDFPVM